MLYFTHRPIGKSSSNPIVTKCGLWVPFPDLTSCAKFHPYRRFWVAGPRRLGVRIDLKGDLYNS